MFIKILIIREKKTGKSFAAKKEEELRLLNKAIDYFKNSRYNYKNFEISSFDEEYGRNFEVITKEIKQLRVLFQAIHMKIIEKGLIDGNMLIQRRNKFGAHLQGMASRRGNAPIGAQRVMRRGIVPNFN